MSIRWILRFRFLPLSQTILVLLFALCCAGSLRAQTATTTTLTISPSTTPSSKTPVTLTATVTAGGSPVTHGTVTFCDLTRAAVSRSTNCEFLAIVGTAQLTAAGTASFKYVPGGGSHSYQAVFAGTNVFTASSSSVQSFAALFQTSTTITANPSTSPATLRATVTWTGGTPSSSGFTLPLLTSNVSFFDVTAGNTLLGTAPLATPSYLSQAFVQASGSPISFAFGLNHVVAGDFNGDGIPDLASPITTVGAASVVNILLGNGDGTFTKGTPVPVSDGPYTVVLGDFNGDGKLDFATPNYYTNNVTVFLGNGNGGFLSTGASYSVPANPYSLVTDDFDRDGNLDLAVTSSPGSGVNNGVVTVLLGDGSGNFIQKSQFTGLPNSTVNIVSADFNRDGKSDLAVSSANSNKVIILTGNGDGTFAQGAALTVVNPQGLTLGDFNGDGIADLASVTFTQDANSYTRLSILLGDGTGNFSITTSQLKRYAQQRDLTVADFNGDGKADLAICDGYGSVSIMKGDGSGNFSSWQSGSGGGHGVVATDLNGDGLPDFVTSAYQGGSLSVYLNRYGGSATATLSSVSVVGNSTHNVNAQYPGDTNYDTSTSPTTPVTAKQLNTAVTLVPTPPSPGQKGQTVTLTATLALPATPTVPSTDGELITFSYMPPGGVKTTLGTAPLSARVATYTLPLPLEGTYYFYASYGGNTYLFGSSANNVPYEILPLPSTTTTLTVQPGTSQYGDEVELTATVSPTSGPTGTVSFFDNGVLLGTSNLDNTGHAVLPWSHFAVGTHNNITAKYNGDLDWAPSTSAPATAVVNKKTAPDGSAALTIRAEDASRDYGASDPPFSYVVSGNFVNGEDESTAVTGTAVFAATTTPASPPGVYPNAISVSGLIASNYEVRFVSGTMTVASLLSTTTLAASAMSTQYGDPITFTATVTPGATGTASFYDGAVYLGEGTVAAGTATLTTSLLDAGSHTVTAIYNGDAVYSTSRSNPVTITVGKKKAANGGAALTITVQNQSRAFNAANPQFSYIVSGTLVNGDSDEIA